MESFVSDIPAGDGKIATFFTVYHINLLTAGFFSIFTSSFRLFEKIQNFFCDIALIPTFPPSIAFPLHFMGRGPRALKAAFLRANKPT